MFKKTFWTILFFASVYFSIEAVFWVLLKRDSPQPEWRVEFRDEKGEQGFRSDTNLGYLFRSNAEIKVRAFRGGVTLHDQTVIHTDAHGRRVSERPGSKSKFALFFGGSCTLGLGVQDLETLPSQFAKSNSDYRAYNYGHMGGSAATMLAYLQKPEFKAEVKEVEGVAVYLMISDHLRRTVGSFAHAGLSAAKYLPYFSLSDDGKPERKGDFVKGRPLTNFFFDWLARSPAIQYRIRHGYFDIPMNVDSKVIHLNSALIIASRDRLKELFPKKRFLVVYVPRGELFPVQEMNASLGVAGIETLDLTNEQIAAIPGDGHPNAEGYAAISAKVDHYLGLGNSSVQMRRRDSAR